MSPNILPFFIAIPMATAFFLSVFHSVSRKITDTIAVFSSALLLILAFYLSLKVSSPVVYLFGGHLIPLGVAWVVDALSVLFLLTINLLAFLSLLYSVSYMRTYTAPAKYYALFMLMLTGLNGVVLSGDLFNMYVFLEIASISSYALVAFGLGKDELEASLKYLILGVLASSLIFLGVAVVYAATGTLNLADVSVKISSGISVGLISFISVLFITGFALKSALVPFHAWLPDAHSSAPAPISAMLSGIFIKVLGIYTMLRVFYNVFGSSPKILETMVFLGGLSMLVGVLLALGQWDFKRLLAYHSISQVGYVVMALGFATPLGILGGLYHLVNHAIFKALLFLNSGSVEHSTNKRDLKQLGGLSEKMPLTGVTSLVASLSISGVPPFNGFWSKLIIIIAAFQASRYLAGALAAVVSVLTLASFLKVQKYAFWGKLKEEFATFKESPFSMVAAMTILAVLCVAMGIFYPYIRTGLLIPAVEVLQGGAVSYAEAVLKYGK